MIGIVDWASARARMILVFVALSIIAGAASYIGLPKEGEPDIDVPMLFVSVPFPGISAQDSEKLLVQPLETELKDVSGIKSISSVANEGYAGVALEFEFGWDKAATLAEVRDKVGRAEGKFPAGAEQYSINEINFSEFPILVISLSGDVPERTMLRVAKSLQDELEGLDGVLEANLAGHRDEMMEVEIDPLRLEAYNVTAAELITVIQRNNQLIAAGEIDTRTGSFPVKIPSSFEGVEDIYNLPVKVNGDRVITLGDLASIRLTFENLEGTARYNGDTTVAIEIVKRKGVNLIDTVAGLRAHVAKIRADWPPELRDNLNVTFSMDESTQVQGMVSQLEASVLTAIALVMIVVLAALGVRSALLVGFAIPTSFLLSFALMAVMGISISNIVMFGLILAVGMLVDGAIVVVEYADARVAEGVGPMRAYRMAAKRMFWPIVSSTATTLCAFLPMLFWPGMPGEFMGNLPVTIIFVLSASLLVALVYLPVVGGVAGRISRSIGQLAEFLHARLGIALRGLLLLGFAALAVWGIAIILGGGRMMIGAPIFLGGVLVASAFGSSFQHGKKKAQRKTRRSLYGLLIRGITNNPIMPIIVVAAIGALVAGSFSAFQKHNNGVEFFVKTEPERAIAYVRARGNLSLEEKDALLKQAEALIAPVEGVESIFAFAGSGGLTQNTGGAQPPLDAIGRIQIELAPWDERDAGDIILARISEELASLPGVVTEIAEQAMGPSQGKPLTLRLTGQNWQDLLDATEIAREHFLSMFGLKDIEDTSPLPGIEWQINVDVEAAGRYGADVSTVGAMVQLVTRGLMLDTMRVDSSDEEIDIRVRLPAEDRSLSTLDTLRVRTADGLVPLSNFVTRTAVPRFGQINRIDGDRFFDVKADVLEGLNANEKIAQVTKWLEAEPRFPPSVSWEWSGDQEEQAESQAFLAKGFSAALGLMFVILLAQFNSLYNSVLVLLAVVLSISGVLIGMLVMGQTFSIIMTGTGIVALAGIVVNNNIVLIDTYQEYAAYMPRLAAIERTAQDRIRPVLLTTLTTMAGLAPMMFGLSIDFINGGYSIDAPTALWWKQLATAVVFGLGLATLLTLVLTPALLALRVWAVKGAYGLVGEIFRLRERGDGPHAHRHARKKALRHIPDETRAALTATLVAEPETKGSAQRS